MKSEKLKNLANQVSRWLRPPSWCSRRTSIILRMNNLTFAMWASANLPRAPRLSRVLRNYKLLSRFAWNGCPDWCGTRTQGRRNNKARIVEPIRLGPRHPGEGRNPVRAPKACSVRIAPASAKLQSGPPPRLHPARRGNVGKRYHGNGLTLTV